MFEFYLFFLILKVVIFFNAKYVSCSQEAPQIVWLVCFEFNRALVSLISINQTLPPVTACRDAPAGGRPWSSAAARATRPTPRWSQWATRRKASSSRSSAEGGGGLPFSPATPPRPSRSTSALRQTRNPSFPPSPPAPQGLSHQGSSASGRARAWLTLCTRPLEAPALEQELTPDSEPLDTAWTRLALGAEGGGEGGSSIDDLDSAAIGSSLARLPPRFHAGTVQPDCPD